MLYVQRFQGSLLFSLKCKVPMKGESTLRWPKNVVTNIFLGNYATFNFHQANIKKVFHKLHSK
jgi:hypothetical protein